MIPLSVPQLKGNEIKYVVDALQSEWVSTSGNYVTRFEEEMKKYLKVDQTSACQSGTAAIHLALKLCGVEKDDEVIVPTLTFIATVNPVKYLGAEPVFMDCDDTLNIDCDKLACFLQNECKLTTQGLINRHTGRRIKALIVVHIFGNMANLETIHQLAKTYQIKLVEDATEALGTYFTEGLYKGRFAGTIGDFGAYSFNGNKMITTGGGGMLVAKDPLMVEKARYLSAQAKDDPLYYQHNEIGYNYRMTNLQAALGVAQLEQLEAFIAVKIKNYNHYKSKINVASGLSLLAFNPKARNNHWFYALYLQAERFERDRLMQKLKENKIETRPIWQLIHTQKMYLKNQAYQIEKAPYYLSRVLNLPCSINLKAEEIESITHILGSL
ncbi:LegC family aminotransferase [Cellulosilyticum sp. I15G10I2]|uniref:LegC family aminotransferase n=1 Tax=Cellulosilyticum sp. I15G10I2 TaxID=1892843 RepID=UPI00085C7F2D|nr:LegC family aminotransferase [Cellulosilyticum sp. I15G10I2]